MLRSAAIYLPSLLLPRLGAFFVLIAGAHLLPSSQLGFFSLVVLIGEFAEMSASNWSRIALVRFGSRDGPLARRFALRMAGTVLVCTLAAIALSMTVAVVLAPEASQPVSIAVAAYVAGSSVLRFGTALHQSMNNRAFVSVAESVRAVLSVGLTLLAMVQTQDFLAASLVSSTVSGVCGLVLVGLGLARTRNDEPDPVSRSVLLRFAGPIVLLALLAQLLASVDRAFLKAFTDAATLGIYAVAFALGRAGFDVMSNALNIGSFVRISALANAGRDAEIGAILSRQLGFMLAFALPAFAVLVAASSSIAAVLVPPSYGAVFISVVPLVALGAIAINLKNFVYDNVFHVRLRNLLQVPTLVAGSIVAVLVGLLLLPAWPAIGAAAMFASGSAAALVASVLLTRRLLPIRLPLRNVLISLVAAGAAFVAAELGGLVFANRPLLDLLWLALVGGAAIGGSLLASRRIVEPDGRIALSFISYNADRITGLSSYSESLIEAIGRQTPQRVLLITNARDGVFSRLDGIDSIEIVTLRSRRWLPYKIDVLLKHTHACMIAWARGCVTYVSTTASGSPFPLLPQLFTLHDLYDLDPAFRPARTVQYFAMVWRWLAMASTGIICVSETTFSEAVAVLRGHRRKMYVIKEASRFLPVVAPATPGPYFLFVANVQNTKNAECLLRAAELAVGEGRPLDIRWIGWDVDGIVANWQATRRLPAGFSALGSVPEADLATAYAGAIALIVPSFREGFCLPVLEAQAFGTPVIASDIAILREVAGVGALYFDPASPEDLLERMRMIAGDAELRRQLSLRALANARGFSWERSARELVELVQSRSERGGAKWHMA